MNAGKLAALLGALYLVSGLATADPVRDALLLRCRRPLPTWLHVPLWPVNLVYSRTTTVRCRGREIGWPPGEELARRREYDAYVQSKIYTWGCDPKHAIWAPHEESCVRHADRLKDRPRASLRLTIGRR